MKDRGYLDLERHRLHAEVRRVPTDPKRLLLLDALREGEHSVGDLAEEPGCGLVKTSQQSVVLRRGFEGTVSVKGGASAWVRTKRPLVRV